MTPTEADKLGSAIYFASLAHRYQRDKGGLPYILHPLAVMNSFHVSEVKERMVAVLHDVVEDTPYTLADIFLSLSSQEIVDAVDAISKRSGETVKEYWTRCKANPLAARVKIKDMEHNSSPERLNVLPESEREYLREKYQRGLAFFRDE